jgi:sugar lactone lactonase YvrE
VITFVRSNVAPQFTSAAAATVPNTAKVAFQVAASGFPAPTFAFAGAPTWLAVNSSTGAVSGIIPPRTLGRFTFAITASNGVAPNASQQFTLSVTGPPFKLTAPATLKGNVTNPFSAALVASGGVAPYAWSLASGTLPAGLALSSAGIISGTPTATGTSTFTVKATDSALPTAETATEPVTITIAPRTLTITTAAVAAAKVGTPYSQSLAAAMGIAPLHWSIASGALPAGLALNATTGVITGTPRTAGTTAVTIKATDATSPTAMVATASYNFVVHANIQAAVFVTNAANSSVRSFALGAGGNASPVTAIKGSSTGLLGTSAVAIDATGRLYVTSLANNTIAEFAYGATGNVTPSSTITGSNTGISYPDALAIDSGGRLYVADYNTQSITVYAAGASGNASPVATIAGMDTGLSGPAALTFDPAGHLWVANYTTSSLTEYAANANGDAKPLATIVGSSTGLSGPQGMTLDSANHLLVSNAYADSLTEYATSANGNIAPLRTISGGATGLDTPIGVDVDADGNIYVANENGGVTEYGATATNDSTPLNIISGSSTGLAAPAGLAVAPPLAVRTAKLRATRVGRHYRTRLRAYLGTTPYRWSVRSGRLPRGLRLTRQGILTGRPRHAGTYRFTVRVRDRTRPAMTATRRLKLVVHHARRRHAAHPS